MRQCRSYQRIVTSYKGLVLSHSCMRDVGLIFRTCDPRAYLGGTGWARVGGGGTSAAACGIRSAEVSCMTTGDSGMGAGWISLHARGLQPCILH